MVEKKGAGMGFLGGLTLLFIALKLTGVVAWSWMWVLAPLWIPWLVILIILFIAGAALVISAMLDTPRKTLGSR